MRSSIEELVGTIAKLMPNIGMVSTLAKSITEVIVELDDYRTGSFFRFSTDLDEDQTPLSSSSRER